MEDVHRLRVFAAAAQHMSFTRAAQTLFLTQSAVSHQIAALEHEFATPLFERAGRTVALTAAGRSLLEQSRRVVAVLDEADKAVRQAGRPDMGTLRIGASPTACQFLIPESLREFRESYPRYGLSIAVGDSPQVGQQLVDGTIDLGIMIRAERNKQLTFHELFVDELGFIVSPRHPWAIAGKVNRHEIAAQHFVMYTRGSATFRVIERHLLRLQSPLQNYIELGSMEAIKELVKLGLGVSVVAPWIAVQELHQRSLVWLKMPGPVLRRTWCLAHRAGRRVGMVEQTFLGLCRTAAANLASST